MTLSITHLHPLFAAEVGGLDLSVRFGEAAALALREALREHRLLVFRGQRLSPADQVALTRVFGVRELHAAAGLGSPGWPGAGPMAAPEDGDTRIHGGFGAGGLRWHADLYWTPQPNRVSVLHARTMPPVGGAAMLFADQCAAFDGLDPWLAYRVQFLDAEHDPARLFPDVGAVGAAPPVAHPVVRVDPDTDRRGLFVDEDTTTRLLGVPEPEATGLLQRLLAAATDPAVIHRHIWRSGDVLVWDNHAELQRAETRAVRPDPGMLRTMAAAAGRPYGPAQVTQPWVVAG